MESFGHGAFLLVIVLTPIGVVKNNNQIVSTIVAGLGENNQESAEMLNQNTGETVENLKSVGQATREIIFDLYASPFRTLARTMDVFADSLQNELVLNLQRLASGDLTFMVAPRAIASCWRLVRATAVSW